MRRRHALPALLLVTDARLGEALWAALERLPRGAGVLFRDHHLGPAERRAQYESIRRIARRRRLTLLLAGAPALAAAWRADGCHGPLAYRRCAKPLLRSMAAHDRRELVAARRGNADLVLVSPIYATSSHPGAPALGRVKLGLMLRPDRCDDVVALGGMTAARARRLHTLHVHRWAAIDGLSRQE